MKAEEAESTHAVMFLFLARDHIPAFLRLDGILHELCPGFNVSHITPIRLHALSFAPADHDLHPGEESLADLHVNQWNALEITPALVDVPGQMAWYPPWY